MEIIDCKGLSCPQPVLRAKDALDQGLTDLAVLVDNEASWKNVQRFGRSRNCNVESKVIEDGLFQVRLVAPASDENIPEETFSAADYECRLDTDDLIYIISSDSMGRGSDELGWALLQTYVHTIGEIQPLPKKIFLYNGGVKLAATEGKALEALQELEKKGVEIWSCGTCLEFFKLEETLQVGQITNMFDILDSMARAGKVVSPY